MERGATAVSRRPPKTTLRLSRNTHCACILPRAVRRSLGYQQTDWERPHFVVCGNDYTRLIGHNRSKASFCSILIVFVLFGYYGVRIKETLLAQCQKTIKLESRP